MREIRWVLASDITTPALRWVSKDAWRLEAQSWLQGQERACWNLALTVFPHLAASRCSLLSVPHGALVFGFLS